jgi:hypothetical protein
MSTMLHTSEPEFANQLRSNKISEGILTEARRIAFGLGEEANNLGMVVTLDKTQRLVQRIDDGEEYFIDGLFKELQTLSETIRVELRDRQFFYISSEDNIYLKEKLFGEKVYEKFSSARSDIKQAGDSLAFGLHTAAVFHLMRVAEHGLRALARDRRIIIPKNKPIELATWEDVLQQLETAENEIKGYQKTLAREAQFDFYHGAMMEVKRFKNKFRNPGMHSRRFYDSYEAKSAFMHVKNFMEILATRISESSRTPKVWRGKRWCETTTT